MLKLTSAIFNGYDKRIRPTYSGGPTIIDMVFEPLSILSLDETEQVSFEFFCIVLQFPFCCTLLFFSGALCFMLQFVLCCCFVNLEM